MSQIEFFPLSPQQKSLWGLPGRDGWAQALVALRLEGPLDVARLRRGLDEIVARHQILRSRFVIPPNRNMAAQAIAEQGNYHWQEQTSEAAAETLALARVTESLQTPFDLAEGPLLRVSLSHCGQEQALLMITLPSLGGDLASLSNIVGELIEAYTGHGAGADREEPVQYVQFADWLSQLEEEEEGGKAYWIEQNEKITAEVLELGDFKPRVHHFSIPPQADLLEVTTSEGAPLRDLLLACWQVLLSRLEGDERLTLGVSFDGRTFPELVRALGPFARYLPVTVDAFEDIPLSRVLENSRSQLEETQLWQDYFGFQKNLRTPRFGFRLTKPAETRTAGGLTITTLHRLAWSEPFALALDAGPAAGGGLACSLYFDGTRYSEEAAALIAKRLETLIPAAAAGSHRSLGSLPILLPQERERLLVRWNQTELAPSMTGTVPQLFEEQAAAKGDNPALVHSGTGATLTFAELNAGANRIAHFLRTRGVGAEQTVALCFDRTPALFVAMLGVLKSGGRFLSIEPHTPADRIAMMVRESETVLILAQPGWPLPDRVPAVILGGNAALSGSYDEKNPAALHTRENAAYLVFTSGSTGKPKGVVVTHANLSNYLNGLVAAVDLSECRSFALVSTISVDLGYTMVFPSLCLGSCLHIMSEDHLGDTYAFGSHFEKFAIDALKITPSHLSALLNRPDPRAALPNKVLLIGGEAASPQLLATVGTQSPGLRVYNHYGPSETTVGVMVRPFAAGEKSLPLGRPIGNTRAYVLNGQMEPLPEGIDGELFIAGESVARGYLGRPDLTAERFVPAPFAGQAGERLYRTGDRVRFLPAGEIAFRGRVDNQVKIRGFRVELGEVEAALKAHAAVREAAVITWSRGEASSVLVAYVVGQETDERDLTGELQSHLSETLPAHMIPAHFVSLAKMPLTPSGKTDRKSLPDPAKALGSDQAGSFEPPANETERKLADIWSELLSKETVGVHDDFFTLGGHSLTGMIVLARIRETFQVKLRLMTLFDQPTIRALAANIHRAQIRDLDGAAAARLLSEANIADMQQLDELPWAVLAQLAGEIEQGNASTGRIPRLERSAAANSFPPSFSQQRLWFVEQLKLSGASYNIPAAIRLRGNLQVAILERCINEIARRHEALRTTFASIDGKPVQIINPPTPLELEVLDLAPLGAAAEAEMMRLATAEAGYLMDLEQGPLLRIRLLRLADSEHVLMVTMHHIISDGWSVGIVVKELAALYKTFLQNAPSPLPELAIQYADFAAWQRERLSGESLREYLNFWTSYLAGAPSQLKLPCDHQRPIVQTFTGASHPFLIDAARTRALKALSQEAGVSLYMTLLSVFSLLLSRAAGQKDIVVGSPIANRNHEAIEPLIGFFINTLVLRINLDGNPTFLDLLAHVRKTMLEVYEYQDLPFEKLVKELRIERNRSYNPLFQVLFILQNTPVDELDLPDLDLSVIETENATSKYDLTLMLGEEGEGLKANFQYNTDLFLPSSMARMAEQFMRLLEQVTAEPDKTLSAYSLADETDRYAMAQAFMADFDDE